MNENQLKEILSALDDIEQTVYDLDSHGDMPPRDAEDINDNIEKIRKILRSD